MKATSACQPPSLSLRHTRGFTLVELMVTVAVLAILLSIGVPSFTRIMASTRMTNQANELVGALNLARSEAIRRGQNVTIRSTDGSGNFQGGWSILTDADGNGSAATPVTATDGTALRDFASTGASTTVTRVTRSGTSPNFTYATSSASDRAFVVYNTRGAASAGPAFFRVCDASNSSIKGRIIQISVVGRTTVDSTTATCP